MRRLASEHEEQAALMRWAWLTESARPELRLLFAIPNGGHRHRAVAVRMKAEGVRPGVPDLCLPVARGGWHGLFIELKTRRGRPSRRQRGWITALRSNGYRVEICLGWERARAVIESYLDGPQVGAAGSRNHPPHPHQEGECSCRTSSKCSAA